MKIKTDNYVCSICRKRNVKLWRPYMDTRLICAECAEKRQSPHEHVEKIGQPIPMTHQLLVDLSDISIVYSSGKTFIIPACPDDKGNFWAYTSVPEENYKWWEQLPTR